MEGKKISFGFTKTKKIEKPVVAEKREYIECLEEKSIKVVGGKVVEEKAPLVIAMKPNTLVTAERLKQIAEEVERAAEEVQAPGDNGAIEVNDNQPVENETLDQMAVRELLNEAKKEKKVEGPALTVAVPTQPTLDGEKESTLEDYEAVPIQEFGMAMLRGMGWTASKEQQMKHKQPELRPKGLGLGADKVIKENQKKNASKDKKDEELSIVKNSFVKITTGKYSGCYGKVVSLDEDNGRVMVDITIKKETVSLSEFMMQAVSKSEYDKQSKVINAESYEEYKKKEQNRKGNRDSERDVKEDREASTSKNRNDHRTKTNDDQRSRRDKKDSNGGQKGRNRSRSKSNDDSSRNRRRNKKRYSSNDSLSSVSDSERQSKRQQRKRYSSESDSERQMKRKEKKRYSSESECERQFKRTETKRYSSESDSERQSIRKEKKRDNSESDSERQKKKKEKKRYNSDSSDSEDDRNRRRKTSSDKKRDIDKKRKGKKKKRDRDRSPNYKKHRK